LAECEKYCEKSSYPQITLISADLRISHRQTLSHCPFLDELVDFFSVNYTKNENSAIQSFKNHPVISNSQLPVSFKGSL